LVKAQKKESQQSKTLTYGHFTTQWKQLYVSTDGRRL